MTEYDGTELIATRDIGTLRALFNRKIVQELDGAGAQGHSK